MPDYKTFAWRWNVRLREGRNHALKHHAYAGTLLYEVLGILDKLAANDPQRFVYAGIQAILNLCNKGRRQDAKRYTERWLKLALAELRERNLISSYFTTYAWDGARYGFVVVAHDAVCKRVGNECRMHAPKDGLRLGLLFDTGETPAEAGRATPDEPRLTVDDRNSSPNSSPQGSPQGSPNSSPQGSPNSSPESE